MVRACYQLSRGRRLRPFFRVPGARSDAYRVPGARVLRAGVNVECLPATSDKGIGKVDPSPSGRAKSAGSPALDHDPFNAGVPSDEGIDRYLRPIVAPQCLWLNHHIGLALEPSA